jgi:PAS domain S-box-containing protein
MEYLAEVWDTDRGLPNFTALALAQTPDGFLWVATFEGLARFDGVHFDTISHATVPEFPGKAVTSLLVDRRGRLWAGSDNGVACLENGHWRAYGEAGGRPVKFATSLFEDREGHLMVTQGERLLRLQDRFVPLPVPPGTYFLRAFAARSGQLWIDATRQFARLENGVWQPVAPPAEIADGDLQGAAPSGDGGVWLAGATSIQKFRDGAWTNPLRIPTGFHFSRIVRFLEDSEGQLWVGDHSKGLLLFRTDGQVLRFTREDGLPNLAIRSLLEDREKNIWVGTDGGGLVRLRRRAANVFDEAQGLGEIVIDSVVERAAGGILAATYGGGLVGFDEATRRFSRLIEQPVLKRISADSQVTSVLEDHAGTIWAGVYGRGIFRIRGRSMEQTMPGDLGGSIPKSLLEDSRQTLWIGTDHGVASYRDGQFHPYGEESGLPRGDWNALAEDGHGGIWAGGPAGLFRLVDGRFQKFLPPGVASYGPITCLYTDRAGTLWIGVEDRGLNGLREGVLTRYGPAQGLEVTTPASIIEDGLGYLWIGTIRQGLARVPVASLAAVAEGRQPGLHAVWLTKEDGLATNQFRSNYQPAVWKGRDGRLWFATLKGLAVVDPRRFRENTAIPPVFIEAVGVSGQRIPIGPDTAGEWVVPPGSRGLQFFFTAPSLTAPGHVRFQYQLEGGDQSWLDTNERSASFGELRPGGYVFRVRAANNDGVWNPQPVALRIRVVPLVWETWWFRLLGLASLALLTAGAAYGSQRRRLRRQTEQLLQEKALRLDVERLQSVLKISEERFSKAFNASPFPLSIATLADARFLDVNESFLERTGLRREEVIGRTRAEVGLWDDQKQRDRFKAALASEGRVRGLDVEMRDRNGRVHHLIVSAEVIDLDGVRCLLSASNDITDRMVLEEQLHQAQKLESVGRLAGGVAHDFNNLLTVINGYSDLLLKRQDVGEANLKRVEQIRKAGDRAAELTQQLLAFSRKQVIQPKVLGLNTLVHETEMMLHRVLPENIEIVTSLEPALGRVMADPGQIHQVVLNLALNARDAMPNGGRIIMETINTRLDEHFASTHPDVKAGAYVMLGVTDTGVGMEEEVRSHIFEPFFTTKGRGAGTGLGLATVYGIVRQNGGWIGVDSRPGKGTTFKIYLPRTKADPLREDPSAAAAGGLNGNETVLLVEDQADVLSFAREVLEEHGYRVLEAANGEAALAAEARFNGAIHLLLTDVVMPGMTGRELAQRLIAVRPETKVLYMSGYTEDVIVHQGVLKEGIAFVPKPLTADAVLVKVRETLGPSA